MKRMAVAVVALIAVTVPGRASAQDPNQQAYESKRQELVKELEQTQERLSEVRSQRVQLTARIENVIAQMMQQRAQALLMSKEMNSLQQLDAILTSSQDNLLAQRDRFTAIGDAVRGRSGAMLVVLIRADSSSSNQILNSATLQVDNAAVESRTYSMTANNALGDVVRRRGGAVLVVLLRADSSSSSQQLGQAALQIDGEQVATRAYSVTSNNALSLGAVDPLYRSNVLPTAHRVNLTASINGSPVTSSVEVTAAGAAVTYVQFAIRNGQIVHTTWTSRGTTPF